jgi:hypothetical protein
MMINSPSVKRIAGKERMMTTGFRILLITEKINPASRKTAKPESTCASL